MLKLIFILISSILVLLLSIYKLFLSKQKRTPGISVFVSAIGGVLLAYILCSFALAIFISGMIYKTVIILLGLSPFIIGKFATYEKENIFSYLQIFIVAFGIFYVLIV